MNFDVFEYSNKGGREYNEDSTASKFDATKGIFIVADGLGGHRFGDLASACVTNTIINEWDGFCEQPEDQLTALFALANQNVLLCQQQHNAVMKSTAAVLAIDNDKAVFANTGDSRVYFFHKNSLQLFTEDHSVAYKKYKGGEITRDMIGSDEDQSRLLRTLGSKDKFIPNVYTVPQPLEAGDAFFLCSDGVWEYLRDEEILVDLLKSENAQHWAELTLVRVMERINAKNDNLSIVAVKL